METYETVIIGQGIAGTSLALHLDEKQKDFVVIDDHLKNSSSLVAAGLYNPIVFRKLNLSFKAPVLVPYLKEFYNKWSERLDANFHTNREIHRIFAAAPEINQWVEQQDLESHSEFMGAPIQNLFESINAEHGIGPVLSAGSLDTGIFLSKTGDYLNKKGSLLKDKYQRIELNQNEILVHTRSRRVISTHRVVFAEGHMGIMNPYFNYLPLGDTKGDVLTIRSDQLDITHVLNRGFFIMPLGDGLFRVGATYEWGNNSYEPSKKGREELISKLERVITVHYEIVDQQSGKRPTVGDRRPLIGVHPEHDQLFFFNGMGSKAVMLAPFYANHFVKHLFEGGDLDPEVDLARYLKHYGNNKN